MNILFIPISILWSICVITNLIVITTFFRVRCLRYNYSYWYTTALAILDLILGSTGIPLQVLTTEKIVSVSNLTCDILISYQSFLGAMEVFVLIGMAIDRYTRASTLKANNDRRAVTKHFVLSTIASITSVFVMLMLSHEYDFAESNCFFLKRNTESLSGMKYILLAFILILMNILLYLLMGYFNIRVLVILREFNETLRKRRESALKNTEINNTGELMEISFDRGKVNVSKIITSNQTIHDIRRGKTMQGWIQESKKQRRLLIMVVALEFTCFFTNLPAGLMYWAINYTPCQICRESVILRNILPWAFYVNQAVDPLMLLLTNRSFRRGARLLWSKSPTTTTKKLQVS